MAKITTRENAPEVNGEQAEARERKDRTPARREPGKGNIFKRAWQWLGHYFSTTRAELQKVAWPTRQETLRLSGIVLGVMIAFSIVLGLLDFLYGELFRIGFTTPVVFLIFGVALVAIIGGGMFFVRRRSADL